MPSCRNAPPSLVINVQHERNEVQAASLPTHCHNPECRTPISQTPPRVRYYCGRKCRRKMNTLGINVSTGDTDARDLGPARPLFGMTEQEANRRRMASALKMLGEGYGYDVVLERYPSITHDALSKAASRAKGRTAERQECAA